MWWKCSTGLTAICTGQKVTSWNIPSIGKNMDYELIVKQPFFKPWFQNKKSYKRQDCSLVDEWGPKISNRLTLTVADGLSINHLVFSCHIRTFFQFLSRFGGPTVKYCLTPIQAGGLFVDHLILSCHIQTIFEFLSWFYGFWINRDPPQA